MHDEQYFDLGLSSWGTIGSPHPTLCSYSRCSQGDTLPIAPPAASIQSRQEPYSPQNDAYRNEPASDIVGHLSPGGSVYHDEPYATDLPFT